MITTASDHNSHYSIYIEITQKPPVLAKNNLICAQPPGRKGYKLAEETPKLVETGETLLFIIFSWYFLQLYLPVLISWFLH